MAARIGTPISSGMPEQTPNDPDEERSSGIDARGIPKSLNRPASQVSCFRLNSPVREALELSVANTDPLVRRWMSQLSTVPKRSVPACAWACARASCSNSQAHLPALTRVARGRPVFARMVFACELNRWQISAERAHCQLIALAIGLPLTASQATAVSR